MDILKKYGTDSKKEVNGAWVTLAAGTRLLIARLGNRLHAKVMTKLYKENHLDLNSTDDELATSTDERLNIEAIARTILLGWEGIEYGGEVLEYSFENAKKLLQHADFRALVTAHSRDMENFRIQQQEAAKND